MIIWIMQEMSLFLVLLLIKLCKLKVHIKITILIVVTSKTRKINAQFVLTINKEFYFLFHL